MNKYSILSPIVDSFKLKNPRVFAAVLAVVMISVFGLDYVLGQEICNIVDGNSVCEPLIPKPFANVMNGVKGALTVLLGLLGAHTPSNTPFINQNVKAQ